MTKNQDLSGHIIVSQPNSADPYFSNSVIIVAKHTPTGAWGLMINKPTTKITLDQIMRQTGILSDKLDKIYVGGPVDTNRVYILHTLDWHSSTTMKITKDIGITTDISILSAISVDQGPALFRTCLGLTSWGAKQLDNECSGNLPWKKSDSWLYAPAMIQTTFHLTSDDQWKQGIDYVAKTAISKWF
jgi:putative transcriptional regulator